MKLCKAFPIFFAICVAIGGAIAYFSGSSLLYGTSIGMVVALSPLMLLGVLYILIVVWCPDRPECLCGKCQSNSYVFLNSQIEQNALENVYQYRCPFCGRTYRQRHKRFNECLDNGSEIPYMVISKWGRWQIERKSGTDKME